MKVPGSHTFSIKNVTKTKIPCIKIKLTHHDEPF